MRNFRVWNEKEKRMIYKGALTIDLGDGAWMWEGKSESFHSHFGELMYGTGRGDKTGQEIFEGDILEISKRDIVAVIWDQQIAGFNTTPLITYADRGWRETVTDHTKHIKILGNIYENPELLDMIESRK